MKNETSLETVAAGGCIFLTGYLLLLAALVVDNYVLLVVGTGIFLFGFMLVQRFDRSVGRSCATSGLLHLLWIGFIGACLFWNASLMVRLLFFSISPAALKLAYLVRH